MSKKLNAKTVLSVIIAVIAIIVLISTVGLKGAIGILFGDETLPTDIGDDTAVISDTIDENGSYFDKDHVALYIKTYGHLPPNYVTKDAAREEGWSGGSVEKYLPGKAIGGDYFGNAEKKLPKKKGRNYYECDIDTDGRNDRGEKRIVYSDDGLIYYTDDHYVSFTLLYGKP